MACLHKILTARDLQKTIDDIKWRRINMLLDIKHQAIARVSELNQNDDEKIFAEIAKSSAAQDLINRIELLTGDDLLAWIKKGGTLNDL